MIYFAAVSMTDLGGQDSSAFWMLTHELFLSERALKAMKAMFDQRDDIF